ncbi:DUF4173 domain-containing protein [Microbispora hainanensis]|uniref:DUF4153 domain-containing protein n=1 Tax=Microbispora hainanensis TaxID=568844 RepID=UPI002E2E27D6|nr:DUF4153 domain-containing protein [Microbispora hainanensis]
MRPLDFLGRIKVKLGIVIVLAVVAAFVVNEVGINSGMSRDLRIAIAVVLAMIMVQLLAHGMTRPLREMAAAAQTIAKGRYGLRVSATSRDEVGELARAFNAMASDLAEVDRQRRELVANVSHELRTPITGLQAVLENIVDGVTPPDLDTLGTALAQTQRLGRLVAQLLDLSRLDSGARLIEPEELDLASLCRQAVSEATLARDDVTVVSAVRPGTVLSADAALLAQVLANLLDNAVRHSPPGGMVRVEARPAGANLEISVTDDGPGIPQAERARVFERFSRLDAGRAADAGGAGLGLAIAKEIVELHGGSISVSDPIPVTRRTGRIEGTELRGGGTAPGCRMVVVLPHRSEPAAAESTDGLVRAGRGDMDVRMPGAGRAEGRPGEHGPFGGETDLIDGTLAPAVSAEKTADEVVRVAEARGEDALVGEARGEGAGASSPATPAGTSPASQAGDERAEAGHGEGSEPPSPDSRTLEPHSVEPHSLEPLRPAFLHEVSASSQTETPTGGHPQSGDHGGFPDSAGALGDSGYRSESLRSGFVHARAGQPGAAAQDVGVREGGAQDAGVLGDGEERSESLRSGLVHARAGQPGAAAEDMGAHDGGAHPEGPQGVGVQGVGVQGVGAQDGGVASRPLAAHVPASPMPASHAPVSHMLASDVSSPHAPASHMASHMPAPHMASHMPAPHVPASRPGAVHDPAGQLARAALGAGLGMIAGFLTGMVVSVILGLGVVVVLLFAIGGAIAGATRGSSSAHRAAPPPWQGAAPTLGPTPGPTPAPPPGPSSASSPVLSPTPSPGPTPGPTLGPTDAPSPGPVARMSAAQAAAQAAARGVSASPSPAPGAQNPGTQNPGTQNPGTQNPGTQNPGTQNPGTQNPGTLGLGTPGPQGPGRYPPPPAYVPPPLFPRPELPDAPRWLLPAAAATGLVAAVSLPDAAPGLGFALTAVAMGAAAFPAVLPLRRGRITPWTVAFGLLAYALVSVVLFRDADWLVGPVLLAAFGVGSLAVSGGGRGWLAVIKGGVSVVFALLPQPWFLSGPIRRLTRRRMLPTLVSALVTIVLLAVFGLLFASADAVFSAFLSDLLRTPDWVRSLPYRAFVFCVFAALAAAAVLVGLRPVAEPAAPDLRMSIGRQVWMIPLIGLNLLFTAFVTVQITVLFGGSRRVLTTAGLTYAQYARSGFFELVTVSLFVLGIVAAAVALLRRESRADRWLLAVLLGLLCAFTLVILASALHRLGLYTDAYGLSRLRASVEATIWWLGAVFVLVLVVGAVRLAGGGTSWFFRALVLLTGVSLFVFAVWDPDARVAETQLTVRGVERLDHDYLSELGAEAVPILDRLPEPDRSCVLSEVVAADELWKPDPWNGWNLARARAREVLERRPVVPPVSRSRDCPGPSRMPGPYD